MYKRTQVDASLSIVVTPGAAQDISDVMSVQWFTDTGHEDVCDDSLFPSPFLFPLVWRKSYQLLPEFKERYRL